MPVKKYEDGDDIIYEYKADRSKLNEQETNSTQEITIEDVWMFLNNIAENPWSAEYEWFVEKDYPRLKDENYESVIKEFREWYKNNK